MRDLKLRKKYYFMLLVAPGTSWGLSNNTYLASNPTRSAVSRQKNPRPRMFLGAFRAKNGVLTSMLPSAQAILRDLNLRKQITFEVA